MKRFIFLLLLAGISVHVIAQSAWQVSRAYSEEQMTIADTIFPMKKAKCDTFETKALAMYKMIDPVIFDSLPLRGIFLVREGVKDFGYFILINKKKNWITIPLLSFQGSTPLDFAAKQIDGKGSIEIVLTGSFQNKKDYVEGNESGSFSDYTQLLQIWNTDLQQCIFNQETIIQSENISRKTGNTANDMQGTGNNFDQQMDLTIDKKKIELDIKCVKQKIDIATGENVSKTQNIKLTYNYKKAYWLRERGAMISF